MGRYSHWEIRFKKNDGESIQDVMDQINKIIRLPPSAESNFLQGICTAFSSCNKSCTEAITSYSDTSFHAQEYLEEDLLALSQKFPDLIFSAGGRFEDDPALFINASDGCLERNIPEIVYPGFSKIIYE